MTTMDAVRLTEAMQALVDARLDTIDRMLLGRAPRADRLAIVREVEGQIHDLLAERGGDEPGRDDVLAVLARLDPPEAYLPEDAQDGPVARMPMPMPMPRSIPPRPAATAGGDRAVVARASGIVGLVALGLFFLAVLNLFLTELLGSEFLLYFGSFGSAGLAFVGGLIAVALAAYARLRGAWAVLGLVTGLLASLLALIGSVTLMALLAG